MTELSKMKNGSRAWELRRGGSRKDPCGDETVLYFVLKSILFAKISRLSLERGMQNIINDLF